VTCLKFSNQGLSLASSSADRSAKIWNVEDGKLLHTLIGHNKVTLKSPNISGQK
jgi:COMPASS component SWD3